VKFDFEKINNQESFSIFDWPKPPFSIVFRKLLILFLLAIGTGAYGQPQDVTFHLNAHLLPGQKILKVKRDFYDSYVWVLATNNQVYRVNTFTPNADGINDNGTVEGLDETATVKVFTRWGAQVYQSVGYSSPWNGEYNGRKLPQGVYYYIITAKNNSQRFNGSLTIIY